MKKIKFLTGDLLVPYVYINPCFYMLKTYHDHFGKYKNEYEWLKPNQYIDKKIDDYVEDLLKEDFDILCAGIYCWNNIFLMEVLKRVREARKECLVIVGGPDVTARIDPDWFTKYHYVDYVIYGDGEKAFSNLLDHFIEPTHLALIPNIIYLKDGKRIITKHETMVREKEYCKISPWEHCKEYLENDVLDIIINTEKSVPVILWERVRGCPYSCSYCDYSSGLHNKVMRRTYDFKIDIDLIADINPIIEMNFVDANVGMFDEDFEIVKYILEKQEKRPRKFIDMGIVSWTKLTSKATIDKFLRIMDYIIDKNYLTRDNLFKISQQDMHSDVLFNVDRPYISWQDHKRILLERFERAKPNKLFSMIELMVGLPGQTREYWNENIVESANFKPTKVHISAWQLVPYAPAQQQSYMEAHKIKSTKMFTIHYQNDEFKAIDGKIFFDRSERDKLIESIKNEKGMHEKKWIHSDIVTESSSFDFKDIIYFHIKTRFYNNNNTKENVLEILDQKEDEILRHVDFHHKLFIEDLEKHGVVLFTLLQ